MMDIPTGMDTERVDRFLSSGSAITAEESQDAFITFRDMASQTALGRSFYNHLVTNVIAKQPNQQYEEPLIMFADEDSRGFIKAVLQGSADQRRYVLEMFAVCVVAFDHLHDLDLLTCMVTAAGFTQDDVVLEMIGPSQFAAYKEFVRASGIELELTTT